MKKNETIDNNTLDLDFVRHRRYEDFSMVPTKPYEMLVEEGMLYMEEEEEAIFLADITPYESEEIRCATDLWPLNGYFFFIDNIPIHHFVSDNLELIRDIGFRMFKVDENIALVIDTYGVNYDCKYFLPLYELLVSRGVVSL